MPPLTPKYAHMNTHLKWLSEIQILDAHTAEVLSVDNTQVQALAFIHNRKLDIIKKTTTAKINEHEKTAKKTIYWHTEPKKQKQFKLW